MKHIRLIVMFMLGVLVGYSLARRNQMTADERQEYEVLKARREGVKLASAPSPSDGEREHVKGIESLADELAENDPDEHDAAFYRQYYYRQQAKHRYMTDLFKSDRDARRIKRLQGGN